MAVAAMNSSYRGRKASWKLIATIKPVDRFDLSGVCKTLDEAGPGWCHVSFTPAFVVDMGKAMPRGVGPHEPAHLMAMRTPNDVWNIFCCYLDGERRLVWSEGGQPNWVKAIKRK